MDWEEVEAESGWQEPEDDIDLSEVRATLREQQRLRREQVCLCIFHHYGSSISVSGRESIFTIEINNMTTPSIYPSSIYLPPNIMFELVNVLLILSRLVFSDDEKGKSDNGHEKVAAIMSSANSY